MNASLGPVGPAGPVGPVAPVVPAGPCTFHDSADSDALKFVTESSMIQVAEGYRAMDERRAIKTLLRPQGD